MRRRTKVLLTAAVAAPLVIGGTGTAYAAHFQSRALPGSIVGGVSVAGLSRAEVAQAVRERAAGVTVTVTSGDSTRQAHLADLGATVDVDATVDAVFAANRSWSAYATSLVSPREVDAVVSTDAVARARVVADLVGGDGLAKDARVVLAKDKRSFVVTPAAPGRAVVPESFQDVVSAAARDLESATATVRFTQAEAMVSTEAAQAAADRANALVSRTVAVSDGDDTHTASAKVKASWVSIPSTDGLLGTPTVDAAKVTSWVSAQAKAAAIEVRTGLRYRDRAGTVRLVRTEARDGRTVKNTGEVVEAVVAGAAYSGRFAYATQKATWDEKRIAAGAENLAYPAAEGEKWVDVDLGAHTISAYVGAEKVYGPVKMVNGSDVKPTVVGTFAVYHKNVTQTMRGSNADGSRYETPDVPWISYFHRGFALHGAPWRSTFGYAGERGSHGCINLPVPVAKWFYDFATIGTVVTTHH
ncbi:L,D-transpeptidase family protein [Oryzobacter telluris]|uniref:L,D-transpeptidase family protein n=1 Tax=Oryzobacter telluris TaxID=3149179 RepID=UPI00370D2269